MTSSPGPGAARRLAREPARPDRIREHPDAPWLVVGAVCVGAFMGQLDASIVTVAFPTLQRSFHAGLAGVEWVSLSYLLALVATVTAVGRIADMRGRKLLYTYGFVLFTASSALCGAAVNLPMLDAFRVLQGLGAALLQANSLALISQAVPERSRGRAIGVQGAAQAVGLALGPTAGGLLIAAGGWRLIFFANVPVGIAGTVLARYLLPRSRELAPRRPFDIAGQVLLTVAVVAALLALTFGREQGLTSPLALAAGPMFVVAGWAFIRRERTTDSPMVDLTLFRRRPFAVGIASGFLSYAVLFGVLFVLPYFLQGALHQSVGTAGLELTALPVALAVVAPRAGKHSDSAGARRLTVSGMLVVGLGCVLLAVAHQRLGLVIAELALVGVGLGLFTPTNNSTIMGAVPKAQQGLGSGLLNMTRAMGTAVGVAVTGLVYGIAAGTGGARGEMAGAGGQAAAGLVAGASVLAALAVVAALVAARAHRPSTPGPSTPGRGPGPSAPG